MSRRRSPYLPSWPACRHVLTRWKSCLRGQSSAGKSNPMRRPRAWPSCPILRPWPTVLPALRRYWSGLSNKAPPRHLLRLPKLPLPKLPRLRPPGSNLSLPAWRNQLRWRLTRRWTRPLRRKLRRRQRKNLRLWQPLLRPGKPAPLQPTKLKHPLLPLKSLLKKNPASGPLSIV